MPEKIQEIVKFTLAPITCVLVSMAATGNGLLCYVIVHSKSHRHVSDLYIASLATADLMMCVIVFPFTLVYELKNEWNFGTQFCSAWLFLDSTLCAVMIYTMSIICMDVCFYVKQSFIMLHNVTRTKIKTLIACTWTAGMFFGSIQLILRLEEVGLIQVKQKQCSIFRENVYSATLSSAIFFFIPFMWCSYVYCGVVIRACDQYQAAKMKGLLILPSNYQLPKMGLFTVTDIQRGILTLGIKLVVFFFSWLPFFMVKVIYSHRPELTNSFVRSVVSWLPYVSSWVNPFIYGMLNKRVHNRLQQLCGCLNSKWRNLEPEDTFATRSQSFLDASTPSSSPRDETKVITTNPPGLLTVPGAGRPANEGGKVDSGSKSINSVPPIAGPPPPGSSERQITVARVVLGDETSEFPRLAPMAAEALLALKTSDFLPYLTLNAKRREVRNQPNCRKTKSEKSNLPIAVRSIIGDSELQATRLFTTARDPSNSVEHCVSECFKGVDLLPLDLRAGRSDSFLCVKLPNKHLKASLENCFAAAYEELKQQGLTPGEGPELRQQDLTLLSPSEKSFLIMDPFKPGPDVLMKSNALQEDNSCRKAEEGFPQDLDSVTTPFSDKGSDKKEHIFVRKRFMKIGEKISRTPENAQQTDFLNERLATHISAPQSARNVKKFLALNSRSLKQKYLKMFEKKHRKIPTEGINPCSNPSSGKPKKSSHPEQTCPPMSSLSSCRRSLEASESSQKRACQEENFFQMASLQKLNISRKGYNSPQRIQEAEAAKKDKTLESQNSVQSRKLSPNQARSQLKLEKRNASSQHPENLKRDKELLLRQQDSEPRKKTKPAAYKTKRDKKYQSCRKHSSLNLKPRRQTTNVRSDGLPKASKNNSSTNLVCDPLQQLRHPNAAESDWARTNTPFHSKCVADTVESLRNSASSDIGSLKEMDASACSSDFRSVSREKLRRSPKKVSPSYAYVHRGHSHHYMANSGNGPNRFLPPSLPSVCYGNADKSDNSEINFTEDDSLRALPGRSAAASDAGTVNPFPRSASLETLWSSPEQSERNSSLKCVSSRSGNAASVVVFLEKNSQVESSTSDEFSSDSPPKQHSTYNKRNPSFSFKSSRTADSEDISDYSSTESVTVENMMQLSSSEDDNDRENFWGIKTLRPQRTERESNIPRRHDDDADSDIATVDSASQPSSLSQSSAVFDFRPRGLLAGILMNRKKPNTSSSSSPEALSSPDSSN